jgi:hypothetical protein
MKLTPYEEIYSAFSNKIKDYDLAELPIDAFEDILNSFMKSAIVKFKNCSKDLSQRDDLLKQFNIDLSDEEIEIIASLMIVEWLNPSINTTELLQQNMSTKDFNIFSPANQLKENKDLKTSRRAPRTGARGAAAVTAPRAAA